MPRDLGDFQTPLSLVNEVLDCLGRTGRTWTRVLEPTCGSGNFIHGLLTSNNPPKELQGIEIQSHYIENVQKIAEQAASTQVLIKQANIFDLDLHRDLQWRETGSLLIIGNPPWVTNSELSTLESTNTPVKSNFKGLSGFDAMTGGSNFDIAEYIWLKLIRELASEQPTIALLCKTSVARNVLQYAYDIDLPLSKASIWKINSMQFFGASVDACLFYIEVGLGEPNYKAEVYPSLNATIPQSTIGIINGRLVSNLESRTNLAFIDGISSLTWRQGLKHDAAAILELTRDISGELRNKHGGLVIVEAEYIYPLLKSSDLGGKEKIRPIRFVIVTQKYIGEDTYQLEHSAPKLWRYLTSYRDQFDQRKSSIYNNQPPFAIFGIGEYSFSSYKVAISGMYKIPKFSAIGLINDRPVMLDDTCYFVPCKSAKQAALVVSLLNDPQCLEYIHSITFWDAKRPITKKLLQRIDLISLVNRLDRKTLLTRANNELMRLGVTNEKLLKEWPENFKDLLVDYSFNNNSAVQLDLLEAF